MESESGYVVMNEKVRCELGVKCEIRVIINGNRRRGELKIENLNGNAPNNNNKWRETSVRIEGGGKLMMKIRRLDY